MRTTVVIAVIISGAVGCTHAPAPSVQITSAECYSLSYSDPVGDAKSELFPAVVALSPGEQMGEVRSLPFASDRTGFWRMFMGDASWKRLHSDSLSLNFSNGFSSVELIVMHDGEVLEGSSTVYYDVVSDGPRPQMRAHGIRASCDLLTDIARGSA